MTDEEQRRIFSKNLNYYISISEKQQKDVANDLGISPTTFNTWCVGKIMPRMGKVQAIADYFNIGKSDLLDDKSNITNKQRKKGVVIPVLGYVRAGIPIDAVEDIIDYEEITEEMASTGDFFGLSIKGDSMLPRMCEGDVVIVKKQEDVESGQIAIVLVNGSDATCKKVIKHDSGISLVSFNSAYEPMFFSKEEIAEIPVVVMGRVVELRGKF